jgi:hypothetical protein
MGEKKNQKLSFVTTLAHFVYLVDHDIVRTNSMDLKGRVHTSGI